MEKEYFIFTVNIILFVILVSKMNATDVNSRSTDVSERHCTDPNSFEGNCKHIKQCPVVLKEFVARSNDIAYVQYIQKSNAKCDNIKPFICCPSDGRTSQFTENNIRGRLLRPEEGCGFSNQNLRFKFGGKISSKLGAFPWIALLGITNNYGESSWKCAGSLITTRHVLTSARCANLNLTTVSLGQYNFDASYSDGVQNIKIIRSERHSNYNERDATNNIAILFLERDVNISPRVRPVCLPFEEPIRSRSFIDYQPYIVGWDLLRKEIQFEIPYEQTIPVLDNKLCEERFQKLGRLASYNQFDRNVICAGYLEGIPNDCICEPGSPLLQPIRDSRLGFRYYQTGIASYGFNCEKSDTPVVFASVQHFIDWIQDKINS